MRSRTPVCALSTVCACSWRANSQNLRSDGAVCTLCLLMVSEFSQNMRPAMHDGVLICVCSWSLVGLRNEQSMHGPNLIGSFISANLCLVAGYVQIFFPRLVAGYVQLTNVSCAISVQATMLVPNPAWVPGRYDFHIEVRSSNA